MREDLELDQPSQSWFNAAGDLPAEEASRGVSETSWRDSAVVALVKMPGGIPLVKDRRFESQGRQAFWKLAGGKSKPGETPERAIVRELEEETGIRIFLDRPLKILRTEDRGNHDSYVFYIDLPVTQPLKSVGDEGELVGIFSPEEILAMPDFFQWHRIAAVPVLKELCGVWAA